MATDDIKKHVEGGVTYLTVTGSTKAEVAIRFLESDLDKGSVKGELQEALRGSNLQQIQKNIQLIAEMSAQLDRE